MTDPRLQEALRWAESAPKEDRTLFPEERRYLKLLAEAALDAESAREQGFRERVTTLQLLRHDAEEALIATPSHDSTCGQNDGYDCDCWRKYVHMSVELIEKHLRSLSPDDTEEIEQGFTCPECGSFVPSGHTFSDFECPSCGTIIEDDPNEDPDDGN